MRRTALRPGGQQGFTLIELMIVVVIIGILTALAVPRFNMAAHQSKEKEADVVLKQVFTLQNAYYAQFGAYANSSTALKTVGFDPPTALKHYTWSGAVDIPMCLASTGPWNSRSIDANGTITDVASC